jgi:Transcription factor TFIID complex subunit 8 C-term
MDAARPPDGPEGFARALARIACAQVLYAQAERQAERARPASSSGGATGALKGDGTTAASPVRGTGGARGARPASAAAAAAESLPPSALHASEAVADALADIAASFILHVGLAAKARSNLAGRRGSALTDVLATLQRISPVTQSHTRDLARYAALEEIPFPSAIAPFPVPVSAATREHAMPTSGHATADSTFTSERTPGTASSTHSGETRVRSSFEPDIGDTERRAAMPWIESWMPPLPPARTYIKTPGVVLALEAKPDRTVLSHQRRMVEQSLAKLKQYHRDGFVESSHALAKNPFLAPPQFGAARIVDEHVAGPPRDPPEPVNDAELDAMLSSRGGRDSNMGQKSAQSRPGSAPTDGRDPKRARVLRILAESAGTGGAGASAPSGPSPSASPAPKPRVQTKRMGPPAGSPGNPDSPLDKTPPEPGVAMDTSAP